MGENGAVFSAAPAKGIEKLYSAMAFLLYLGPFHLNLVMLILIPLGLLRPSTFIFSISSLGLLIILALIPLKYKSAVGTPVAKFICKYAVKHFPVKIVADDIKAFDPNRSYVVALEPHSVTPLGVLAFAEYSHLFPLKRVRILAANAALSTPILRQIWTWVGARSVARKSFQKLLHDGISCVFVPGGVQECLYMKSGREVVYLKKRLGFIKLAIQEGSPVVPVFVFNQTKAYSYLKPKSSNWYTQLSRAIGFPLIWIWGEFGTIIPYRIPMYIAVGKPIEFDQNEAPSQDEVAGIHANYLKALEELFEKHKEAAGCKDIKLDIY